MSLANSSPTGDHLPRDDVTSIFEASTMSSASELMSAVPDASTASSLFTDSLDPSHVLRAILRVTHVYIDPAVVTVGLASNTLAGLALWRRAKKSSTYNYLIALVFADSAYLLVTGVFHLLLTGFGNDIRSSIDCNVVYLLLYPPSQMSSWFLCLCCTERAVRVWLPVTSRFWFSPRRARAAIAATACCVLAANWHHFGALKTSSVDDIHTGLYDVCQGRAPAIDFYHEAVYPWVDSALYSFAPLSILTIVTIATGFKYFLRYRVNRVHPDTDCNETNNSINAKRTKSTAFKRITLVTVSLAVIFLVTNLPVCVSILVYRASSQFSLRVVILCYVLNTVSLLNHCVNLWLYLIFSNSFRKDIKALFRCKTRNIVPSDTASSDK